VVEFGLEEGDGEEKKGDKTGATICIEQFKWVTILGTTGRV
jgi:hypothetical protein